MARYSEEFKSEVVRKMMPPNARRISDISRETGVSAPTLYAWRNTYRDKGIAVPADPSNPEQWDGAAKLSVVLETEPLNARELSEYCREKGLYAEQIARWKASAIQGNEHEGKVVGAQRRARQSDRKRIKQLERELRRKEKALAEAAALLILKKKAQALWGEPEEE